MSLSSPARACSLTYNIDIPTVSGSYIRQGSRERTQRMSSQKIKQINVGVIGTGWCGGIRANSCAGSPLVNELHIAETNPQRLKEVKLETSPVTAVVDY